MSDEEDFDCPLCMEEMDISDRNFKPCPCGYQICRFCWNHIKQNLNGKCPACRRDYSDNIVEFTPITPAEIQRFKNEKRQKEREKKEMEANNRRHLANMRVVQKNLCYVIGLGGRASNEELLRQHDYFGQYGKILKIVINKRALGNDSDGPAGRSAESTTGVYVTFAKKEDAAKCIIALDGTVYEGRVLRASYGTTKYCSFYLRGLQCQNPACMYLHEPGEDADSFTKEEMTLGKHHVKSGYTANSPSPAVGESSVSQGVAAPIGVNAPQVAPAAAVDSVKRSSSLESVAVAPAQVVEEWPVAVAAATPVAPGSPAVLPKTSAWAARSATAPLEPQETKNLNYVECDIFNLVHPKSEPSTSIVSNRFRGDRANSISQIPPINTSQLHRYLFLSKQAREYYIQLSQSIIMMPDAQQQHQQMSSLFVFNPFKTVVEQEQSRFGFAQQRNVTTTDNMAELAERFNRLNTLQNATMTMNGLAAGLPESQNLGGVAK